MSSEPPPGRRGHNSFEDMAFQERRQDTSSVKLDDDSESDDEDLHPMDPAGTPPGSDTEGTGAEQIGDPVDMTSSFSEHRVFANGSMAHFTFEVDERASFPQAKWVAVFDEDDVRDLPPLPSPLYSSSRSPGRVLYTIKEEALVVPTEEYFRKKMFVVLDGSNDFESSFALEVFGMVARPEQVQQYHDELVGEIESEEGEELRGGFTTKDSLWYRGGMTTEPIGDDGDGSKESGSGGSAGSPSTLSNGAKAGIGVGAGVAGLIIIGLAIFFFFLRRRRKRAAATDKSLTPANDYMRDKEAHAAQIAETPHSPASDDDNRPRDSAFIATGDAAPPADRSSAVATPTSERRQVPHSVAHLVEEGMTEEQIRRLEEEERALDQAIERAGRN